MPEGIHTLSQLVRVLGMPRVQVQLADQIGLLPVPEAGRGRWSARQAELLRGSAEQIRQQLRQPLESTRQWAQRLLEPGVAVVLDTETTGMPGSVVEVAVIDAASGQTLLDTLVNPGCQITRGAYQVHGITQAQVADAPSWGKVFPELFEVAADRRILCYNASFDFEVVCQDTRRAGLDCAQLGEGSRWECIMRRRAGVTPTTRWLALGGSHRALGDALAARQVLMDLQG